MKCEQTKRELIRVAADLPLRQGFRRTSLDEIPSEAAIPKRSLYLYFKNKAELGRAVSQYRRGRSVLYPSATDFVTTTS